MKKPTKRNLAIATATAVLVGGGAATAFALTHDGAPAPRPLAGATANKAVETALSKVPGTVAGAELDDDGEGGEWEVDVYAKDGTWHEVTVDAKGTEVVRDHEEQRSGDAAAPAAPKVTLAEAVARAERATKDRATSAELEDGVWEVELRTGSGKEHEVRVDAATGKAAPARQADDDGADTDD
ncbi:PepSY domain-containing protein [Streptomyces sp. NPDC050504]|uniref:PepSY domain-containing protein n=1 Tax=Streptomyces sp. NPDC050504 TaxID=3365618 RepID=UPI0037B59BCF